MADITEYWQGIAGDQDRRQIRYYVTNATDDKDALDQLELDAPFFYDNMPRENITIRELSKKDGLYEGIARYTRRSFQKPAEETNAVAQNVTGVNEPTEEDPDKGLFSFDVAVQGELELFPEDNRPIGSGGQFVVGEAGFKEDGVTRYQQGPTDGYNYDQSYGYRGRDILRPSASFTLDLYPEDSKVDRSYQKLVMDSVGKVNSVRFRKYLAGEVMLVAARGESRNSGDWQFSLTFEVRLTRTNVNLGNGITFATVEGWDLIDPWNVPQVAEVGGEKFVVHRARQAIVWRPYARTDFGPLFI